MAKKLKGIAKGEEKGVVDRYDLLSEDSIEGKKHRQEVFKDLLQHLEQGYSLDSFGMCDRDAIFSLSRSFASDWPEKAIRTAHRKGQEVWENLGYKQAAGLSMGNASAWKFAMSAKYGWTDKLEVNSKHSGNVDVTIVSYARDKASQDSDEA